jgi:hypothetical protein
MKKLISISFAFLILLSGMHLSIATHFCEGKVEAMKWSFTGVKATCEMENTNQNCPIHNGVSSNCCHNEISFLTVDNNYNTSSFKVKDLIKSFKQVSNVPINISFNSFNTSNSNQNNVFPPGFSLTRTVSLAKICIFRI